MRSNVSKALTTALLVSVLCISLYSLFFTKSTVSDLQTYLNDLNYKVESLASMLKPQKYSFPLTITDMVGREVHLPREPERIVSMAPSVTETLFALNLKDKIVGVTEYCNYPEKVNELKRKGEIEVIGGFTNPSIEKIIELEPDLVIAVNLQERIAMQLESLGLTVLTVKSESLRDIYTAISLIGKATGKQENAAELNRKLQTQIKSTWEKIRDIEEKAKVLHIAWLEPLYVAGGKSYVNDLISMAGGINVFQAV